MIRSGGSIIKAAQAYRKAGASKIIIACTHLILTKNKELETLKKVMGCADALIATDSVRPADALPISPATKGKIHFVSLAQLLAEAVKAGGRVDEKAIGSL
jgi:phosphoribosylpyrophosphate synthetase